jgi:carbamoyltransferase
VLTLDGSGDHQCTTIWRGSGDDLTLLWEAEIPQSLGWFYSAMTEYLGFESYDGEYKVVGLAAFGRPHAGFRAAMDKVLKPGPAGFDYELDRDLIHNGPHSYSSRFTDNRPTSSACPCAYREELTPLHEDFAFEAQDALERTVFRLLDHFRNETGLRNLVIGGGVAQNVKMNGRIYQSGMFDDMFLFPIPSDSGTAVGAALGIYYQETRRSRSKVLDNVYWGPSYSDEVIEAELRSCGLVYTRPNDLEGEVAELLATGHIVGWVQGGMEGGARALGARSILADPRTVEARDRVNHAIKFREYWRPFCPSMTAEAAQRFMVKSTNAPFMILTFKATEEAATMIPAVVHIDGTSRIQTVDPDTNPRFYRLLKAFEARTGVAVVLNTSFNIKGEPIVCTPKDALRTFWSTGLDALAIGSFLLVKPSKTTQEAS